MYMKDRTRQLQSIGKKIQCLHFPFLEFRIAGIMLSLTGNRIAPQLSRVDLGPLGHYEVLRLTSKCKLA